MPFAVWPCHARSASIYIQALRFSSEAAQRPVTKLHRLNRDLIRTLAVVRLRKRKKEKATEGGREGDLSKGGHRTRWTATAATARTPNTCDTLKCALRRLAVPCAKRLDRRIRRHDFFSGEAATRQEPSQTTIKIKSRFKSDTPKQTTCQNSRMANGRLKTSFTSHET